MTSHNKEFINCLTKFGSIYKKVTVMRNLIIMKHLFWLFVILKLSNANKTLPLKPENETFSDLLTVSACKKKPKLKDLDIKDNFDLIEIKIGTRLSLACNYCDEQDDYTPKIWKKQDRFKENNVTEVELGVKDVLIENRIHTKPDHTLVINEITKDDIGFYYCGSIRNKDAENKIIFLVDALKTMTHIIFGSIQNWKEFVKTSYDPISNMFLLSNRQDFLSIREHGINIQIHSEWLPWGACDGCRKIRTRLSDCRLKPTPINNPSTENYNNTSSTFLKLFEFSCFSLDFEKNYPNISKDLQKLGIFAMKESCYSPCKYQFKSSSLPRYKNILALEEGEHFKFTCPESSLASEIVWRKDGAIIEPFSHGENLYLDSFHSLHITSATEDDSANYTCYVDNVRMQEIIVIVRVNSILGSEEFSRHLIYLVVLFSLCFLMYISGIVLSWKRRHSFTKIDFSELQGKYSDKISVYSD